MPRLLDLYCCQGGASVGYYRAGFSVIGVDINPQPRYPFSFYQADAIEFLEEYGSKFDIITASPPCQWYSKAQRIQGRTHPDLIGPTRAMLLKVGRPYVIENVEDAYSELIDPVCLCGTMFNLTTYRHRLFESGNGISLTTPEHPIHVAPNAKMGRPVKEGEFMHIVGNFSGVEDARQIMGMPWASRDGLREAIPPAYSEYIGSQLLTQLGI